MVRFIVGRLLAGVATVAGVVSLVFLLMHLAPGDPVLIMLGSNYDQETYRRLVAAYGLDLPLWQQYLGYLWGVAHGDLGFSYRYVGVPVATILGQGVPVSMELGGMALALMVAGGVPLGVLAATRHNTRLDAAITGATLLGYSIPAFVLIPIGMLVFGVKLHWLPVAGWGQPANIVLPVATYAIGGCAFVTRLTRAAMLDVLHQEFLTTARSKGLSPMRVIFVHAFRNALVGIIPVIGLEAGFVLGGAVYIETVFQWPGIGRMLVSAISTRDILLVQGGVLVIAFAYVIINLLADIGQSLLDPRIRAG